MADLKTYYLVRFNRRTGKIDTTMSALGKGLIQYWGLMNTTKKSQDTVIFDEDGWITAYYRGTGDFPEVEKFKDGEGDHIDTLCEGLLEAVKKGDNENGKN